MALTKLTNKPAVRVPLGIIEDLSQAYEFATVADMKASVIIFPLGKKLTTKGYYATGDCSDLIFLIKTLNDATTDGDIIDEFINHTLDTGDVAILQIQSVINVKQAGLVCDGVTDDSVAFQNLMDYISSLTLKRETIYFDMYYGGLTVEMTGDILLSTQIKIDGSNCSTFRTNQHGCVITWDGDDEHGIVFMPTDSTRYFVTFDGIIFYKTSVGISGNSRIEHNFINCEFRDTNRYAIEALGASAFGGIINNTQFNSCVGCISINHNDCDLWTIRGSKFWRSRGTALIVGSSGVLVENCDFELSPVGVNEFILIDSANNLRFINNRFGSEREESKDLEPPEYSIRFTGGLCRGVLIAHNLFQGINISTTSPRASGIISVNTNLTDCQVVHNEIRWYPNSLINNQYFLDGSTMAQYGNNLFEHNMLFQTLEGKVFNNWNGWSFQPDNLMVNENNLFTVDQSDNTAMQAAFAKYGTTLVKVADLTDGSPVYQMVGTISPRHITLSPTLIPNANAVKLQVTARVISGVANLRMWLRDDGVNVSSLNNTWSLTSEFRTFEVAAEVSKTGGVRFSIGHGNSANGLTRDSTIEISRITLTAMG